MLTEEQRKARKKGIGGSDVAAILGATSYATAVDVFLEKTTDYVRSFDEESDACFFGNYFESAIIARFIDRYPQKFTKSPELDTIYDKENTVLFANLDALLEDGSVLEAKTVGEFTAYKWGEPFTDQIPNEYLLQVMHYAGVCNPPNVFIAALFGVNDFRVYEYKRNREYEQIIRDLCLSFWENNVLKNIPPEPQELEDCRKLWTTAIRDSQKYASVEIIRDVQSLKSIRGIIKDYEEEENRLKKSICEFLKDEESIIDGAGKKLVTWKNQSTKRFILDEFKKDHPLLYQQYLAEKSTRVLRINGD